jgi:hypothetical protein
MLNCFQRADPLRVRPPALEIILLTLLVIRTKVKNGLSRFERLKNFHLVTEVNHTNMKIYFGFTVAGDRSQVMVARQVVELLEAMGHEVLSRHLVSDNAAQMDRIITPQAVYERNMNWLRQCDIFIAEVSGSSFGLGYEAGFVLGSSDKRVVLFYRRELAPRISLLITGNTHPNCTLIPYSGPEEIEAQLCSTMNDTLVAE